MLLNKLSEKAEEEIRDYTKNVFEVGNNVPQTIEDEPFIETFKSLIDEIKCSNIEDVLNESFPHGEEKISFKNPKGVTLEIYKSIAGNIPIFYAKDPEDFEELVTKIIHKGKVVPNLKSTGASFAHGKNIKFIILSYKPYSNIDASELGLDDQVWKEYSMIIRREHECTHYFTKRFLGSSRNNIHDELLADFAGIVSACDKYYAKWFLRGMGIDEYPNSQPIRRFPVYTQGLSEEALDALKRITIKAAQNVEKWSELNETKKLSLVDKILFLTSQSLLDLSRLYD